MNSDELIPSPQATGNAGAIYEQHVGAACLSILLAGGIAPFTADSELIEVHLQVRHRHFQTDDVLLVTEASQGTQRRIPIQVKRSFSLAASDEECVKTLHAAWNDFTNTKLFNADNDRIGLIIGQSPTSFAKGMRALLDLARATLDAADFSRRLGLKGCISSEAKGCYATVADIVRKHAGEKATDEALWRFLRVWDFAVLDFHAPSSISESLVKSVLAATANGRATIAAETWNSLLNLVGEGAGTARSFNWRELPAELKERHRQPAAAEREATDALRTASDLVRAGVIDQLARTISLARPGVLSQGLAQFNDGDALLITGAAGSGKSVIAAKIYDALTGSGLALAFRADTLATPHLATSAQHIGVGLRSLLRVFALHPRKLFWIESGERLFEKTPPERESFSDLLRMLTRERGWKILITCRDYTAEQFRTVFLEPNGIRSAVLTVPPLTDSELDAAGTALPALRVPLGEPALLEILRNPFYLHLAARMSWSADAPPAVTRRAFRHKAWSEVVCRTGEGSAGLSIERDQVMIDVALRRARALVPYVEINGLSARAVEALSRDSLLAPDPNDPTARAAPAHDLYEDWALLQWLSRLLEQTGGVNTAFFDALGTYPAMRRCFRLWLLEQLDGAFAEAQEHVFAVMSNTALPAHWRDEALVAVFQSVSAPNLLQQLGNRLVSDVGLLRRAVHLLRVSCRSLSEGGVDPSTLEPDALVPSGFAWNAMPAIILQASQGLLVPDLIWILAFLEDWARAARVQPDPPAAMEVARLCILLLRNSRHILESYQETFRERVLRVMLSVPRATKLELQAMIEKAVAATRREGSERHILRLIWSHFSGAAVARDLPEMTLRVVDHHLHLSQPDGSDEERRHHYQGMDLGGYAAFGLGHLSRYEDYHPASAWQGPFLNLLTYHPEQGIALLIRFVNRCCTTYATSGQRYERSFEMSIELEDGAVCRQWANGHLWRLYRATSVGPTDLASALMALETWLLQMGERGDANLRDVFSRLLRESNNVAITAVLVSVALAYPYLLGEAAMPLIKHRGFFDAENERQSNDLFDNRPQPVDSERDPESRRLWQERSGSAKLPHRQYNLESLAVMLQLTSARPRVWALIDHVREQLLSAQNVESDEVRLWLLKLHRMDVRNFEATGETDEGHLLFKPGPPSSELQAYRDRALPVYQERERRTEIFLWGRKVFEGSEPEMYRPEAWRDKLTAVRGIPTSGEEDSLNLLDGAGGIHIAAVCLRDHWDEMDDEERAWCGNAICTEMESLTQRGAMTSGMLALSGGVSPAAQLISMLLARSPDPSLRLRAKRNLSTALFHAERQLALSAAYGIGAYLFSVDRAQALSYAGALIEWDREMTTFHAAQRDLPRAQRERVNDFDERMRARVHVSIEQDTPLNEATLFSMDFLGQPGVRILQPLLEIFRHAHADPLALRFHEHLAAVLLNLWQGTGRRRTRQRDEEDDSIESDIEEFPVARALARFILSCAEATAHRVITLLAGAVHTHPTKLAEFVEHLIHAEDNRPNPSGGRFWMLWKTVADAACEQASQGEGQDAARFSRLLSALFLDISWKPETQEWRALTGNGSRALDLFQRLPSDAATLRSFSVITARFRSEFVPRALPSIAEKLSRLTERLFLSDTTMNALETVLGALIFSGASDVRRHPELRGATLSLLDMLVDAGSSAAFKMRDDFLTPLRG